MRPFAIGICLLAAACGGGGLKSPASPTSASLAPESVPATDPASAPAAAAPAQVLSTGGSELPLRGSFTRTSHSTFEPPMTLVISGTATGTATHLGEFTATSVDRVDTANDTGIGTFDLTAANGDQLFTTTAGVENSFVPPNISNVTLAATIVGGTGRFAGATGDFTIQLTETIDFATSSAGGSGSFEGHVDLNR